MTRIPRQAVAALSLILATGALTYGFEYGPVAGVPGSGEPARRLDFLLGLDVGTDTNVTRVSSRSKKTDAFYGLMAGIRLVSKTLRSKFFLGAETRYRGYAKLGEYDYKEYTVDGGFEWSSKKARLALEGRFATPSDPVEAETLKMDLLERRTVSCTPTLELGSGKSQLGLGYSYESLEFDNYKYSYLDHGSNSWNAEYRLWLRPQATLLFVGYDSGTVDYVLPYDPAPVDRTKATDRKDFDYTKLLVGWRAGSPRGAHFEIGMGGYTVSGESISDATGLAFSFRSTIHRDRGNSRFTMAYTVGPEAAATADYKLASRIQVNYARKVNLRWSWSFGYHSENSAFENAEDPDYDTLSMQILRAGVQRALGSGHGWHGRFYCALDGELGEDFDRLRAHVGIGLAH